MLAFVFLHITGIVLSIMAPMLTTSKDTGWLCSSTIGCTMTIGINNTRYGSMNPLCKPNKPNALVDALNIVGGNVDFPCWGSKRCCSHCRLPLTFGISQGPTVHVTTRDELQVFFHICVWIMAGGLAFQLMVVIIVTCSKRAKKDTGRSYEDKSQLIINSNELPSMDMVTRVKGSAYRWRLVIMLCTLSGSLVLVAEMSLLGALVLVPAVPYINPLSCFIYEILYFITALAVYTCMTLILERYIIFSKEMQKGRACIKTCICKNILSVMSTLMWLMILGGLITVTIYCIILARNNKF